MSAVVYRMFDADDRLLYVGCSNRWISRLAQHRSERAWFDDVVRVTLAHYETRPEALAAERLAQRDENPVYNIVRHGTKRPRVARGPRMARPGTPLKIALAEEGFIHAAFAARVGMRPDQFSRIVNGMHCDEATRQAIAMALGRTVDELWPASSEVA